MERSSKRKAKEATASQSKRRRTAQSAYKPPAPVPTFDINTKSAHLNSFDAETVSRILLNTNLDQVASALNALTKATNDVESNYCLGMGGEKLLEALVKLFDEVIGWDVGDGEEDRSFDGSITVEPTWEIKDLRGKHRRWADHCREKLASPSPSSTDSTKILDPETDVKILEVIVTILRNLSFVAQNLRFLCYSEGVLRVLTGSLYYRAGGTGDEKAGDDSNSNTSAHQSNMCVNSLHALVNLAGTINLTGRQMFIDRVLLESPDNECLLTVPEQQKPAAENENGPALAKGTYPKYGMSTVLGFGGLYLSKQYDFKSDRLDNVPDSVVHSLVGGVIQATYALFPAIANLFEPNDITSSSSMASGYHRPSVISAIEFLTELISKPDNKDFFLNIPNRVLESLTEFLFIPRLTPESLDYVDPCCNIVTRVSAMKLMVGYDTSVDSDVRDRSCDLLIKLTDGSPEIQKDLGLLPPMHSEHSEDREDDSALRRTNIRLYDSLLSMVESTSGSGAVLAIRLLNNLALSQENKMGKRYVERKLLSVVSRNSQVSNLAFNGVLSYS
ncbi:hypothetical protein THAOC_34842 [Thalassiosira oceanica]|uniref:SWI/SNF-like complex subunit BAF250 C-terminal domain-containing protein n=1 Tax=Thalassiosira oceanica TaxID=159749 RepID=K0RBL8_THAOC|nr:hypothetical protein THAOC_34842 [Thalassiosira oceanica]|eukprot:EJK46486.1 hypothetical protein THAOC_34842 [Thalassiosira oceanica]